MTKLIKVIEIKEKYKKEKEIQRMNERRIDKQEAERIKTEKEIKIIDEICELLSTTNKSIATLCEEHPEWDISYSTVYGWLRDDKHAFMERHDKAIICQARIYAGELITITDDDTKEVYRSKLMFEGRKFIIERLLNKQYGQKIQKEHSGSIGLHEMALKELE